MILIGEKIELIYFMEDHGEYYVDTTAKIFREFTDAEGKKEFACYICRNAIHILQKVTDRKINYKQLKPRRS